MVLQMINLDKCPCEECIVRATCRNHFIKKNENDVEYLVIELYTKCPFASDYYLKYKHSQMTYEVIDYICNLFKVKDEMFVWHYSSIKRWGDYYK